MSTHTDRAARMGYGAPAERKPRPALNRGKSLYDSNLDLPLSNYYTRREVRLSGDAEGINAAREERRQLAAFAHERGISAADIQQALSVGGVYDAFPRSDAAKATLRAHHAEKQRLELGGIEQVKAHMRRVGSVTKALEIAVPSLVARVRATGAAVDSRLFDALAPYGEKTG